MQRRKWTSKEKLQVVIEGLKGAGSISEICTDYKITQSRYYHWRDKLLPEGERISRRGGTDGEIERLQREKCKLKETVGELTMELKKNEW